MIEQTDPVFVMSSTAAQSIQLGRMHGNIQRSILFAISLFICIAELGVGLCIQRGRSSFSSCYGKSSFALKSEENNNPENDISLNSFRNDEDVKSIIKELKDKMAALAPSSTNNGSVFEEMDTSSAGIKAQFDEIFRRLKAQSMSEKEQVDLLVNIAAPDMEGKKQPDLPTLKNDLPCTSLYSPASAPILLVHGTGPVSIRLLNIVNSFGKAASFRLINGSTLSFVPESELKFALRDIKSIIIAPDAASRVKKGWFGQMEVVEADAVLNAKGLKRLLNGAYHEMKRSQQPIKVVSLGKASKVARSVGSYLVGDTTDFDSEVILECSQRQLGYQIVQVGKVVEDITALDARNIKYRGVDRFLPPLATNAGARSIQVPSVTFTNSKIIEANEVTSADIAAEALLRAVSSSHRNGTIAVLSVLPQPSATPIVSAVATNAPNDEEWNDEFLKLDGPELLRRPLQFADEKQARAMLDQFARRIHEPPDIGLITPVRVEKFHNAIRLAFAPVSSSYVSSKEEKQIERNQAALQAEQESAALKSLGATNPIKKSRYVSPEEEARMQVVSMDADARPVSTTIVGQDKTVSKEDGSCDRKTVKNALTEGGLDILVETRPYVRIRVKRCLMGPKTIVKEESERLLLDLLQRMIGTLENDVRILFKMLQ